ncbi:hypothetical protein [Microvirga makkahensis]|uniref:hypothetical protein n=1 Tax=Microvirga makkahensis TaxID=1128670 RepID=UPI00197C7604|nr:hypothetical protein [Microvirga makkahensis]
MRTAIASIARPHVPHGWDAGAIYEKASQTLFCGDFFTHRCKGPAHLCTDVWLLVQR